MAFGTKRNPLPTSSLALSKFNHFMNTNIFQVLILKPLQLLFCLLVVTGYNCKLRLKVCVLRAENFYLRFKMRRLVKRK